MIDVICIQGVRDADGRVWIAGERYQMSRGDFVPLSAEQKACFTVQFSTFDPDTGINYPPPPRPVTDDDDDEGDGLDDIELQ